MPEPNPGPTMALRTERLLAGIDIARARGLEVGALTSPIVRRPGSHVLYADHADTATLRAKYAGHDGIDADNIVEVDVVWADRPLSACLPPGTRLDYVVASHVIEHVPDLIGWLRQVAEMQPPGGLVCLAIPDKRFTFDFLRPTTRLADVVDAHLRQNRRPMPAQVFAHHAEAVKLDWQAAWRAPPDPASLERHHSLTDALNSSRVATAGEYVDVHCWVFTPRSLMDLFAGLVALDLLPYRCAAFHETEPCALEMLLVLERRPDGGDAAERATAEASFAARAAGAAAERPDALAAARDILVMLASELRALRASRSWRVTAPLRGLRRLLGGV